VRYAITGSCGLIGQKLKKRLDDCGHECVMEVDVRKGSNVLNINSTILNQTTQKIDIFFHLAAHCKINEGTNHPSLPHKNNCQGTYQALEFCRKNNIKKFVYMSSSRVLSPEENPYTASKKYGENLCKAYYQCYGIEYIIIRPSTVYSEGHDLTRRLLTNWVINAMTGKPLEIYGDENKALDFTHIDDFVDGVMLLLFKWEVTHGDSYDISGDDYRTLVEVYTEIIKQTGSKSELVYTEPEVAQPQNVSINIDKMKKLGYNPKIKLEEGIKRMIDFYKTEGKKWLN